MEEQKEELTYEKAIAELETLVERVEEKDAPLDRIEKDIKRAMQLIAFCKTQLRGYKERFSALMDDSNEDSAEG
ncbi:MAG: exodeoxyribonuclease VII small subunit [Bacteroidales bacterium]|nr:exodeoxyribonuclease VII small subunit [Bacteroidales bacterium]MBQ2483227.1 exodeoxyribonuclease VII small subunit [Bacteroidales bacterium]MBQ2492192.1 exodeoxyribonuclease VII small subunit [Bacteroidales bacterium]MBQ4197937.1 exodeoxyribonuclease VII small subunit [Bacteroidales bacterium]